MTSTDLCSIVLARYAAITTATVTTIPAAANVKAAASIRRMFPYAAWGVMRPSFSSRSRQLDCVRACIRAISGIAMPFWK